MAPRVTSSRDRGKGKARKPVTTSKGRANRQGAASGRPITQRGRQERGGARVTQGRGAAPTQAPALPPGRKGGPLARRTTGGQPRLPGGTGNQPRLPGGTGGAPRGMRGGDSVTSGGARTGRGTPVRAALPPSTRVPAPGPTGVVKLKPGTRMPGVLRALGGRGNLLLTALSVGTGILAAESEKQRQRIADEGGPQTGPKGTPTGRDSEGLNKKQRDRNKAADFNRNLEQQKAAVERSGSNQEGRTSRTRGGGGEASQPSGGGGGARVPQTGGGGRPSAMPAAVTRAQTSQPAGQSKNMDENYATWTRANRKLAERVKPGQAGYSTIQKTLAEMKGSQPTSTPGPRPKTQQEVAENLARAGRQASGEGGEGGFRANAPNLMPGMKPGNMGSPKDFEGGEGMDFGAQLPDSAMPQWLKNLKKKYK